MEEVIIIRIKDPDGSVFKSIMDVLHDKPTQIFETVPHTLSFGDVEIYPTQRKVVKAGKTIHLNYGEFSILYCMARSPGQVFSREQLYNFTWDDNYEMGTNTIDNTIWRLRSKLEPDPKHPIYIKTVFRIGYKIEV